MSKTQRTVTMQKWRYELLPRVAVVYVHRRVLSRSNHLTTFSSLQASSDPSTGDRTYHDELTSWLRSRNHVLRPCHRLRASRAAHHALALLWKLASPRRSPVPCCIHCVSGRLSGNRRMNAG